MIRSRGGRSPHPELRTLPARELAHSEKLVYLIVDGLGRAQLDRHLAEGGGREFFARRVADTISTVFPATTAAAITTLSTGASPAEHGVLGWHLHLADLGCVATILPTTTRMGTPLAHTDFVLRDYLQIPSYVESVRGTTRLISYGTIPLSRFSQAGTKWNERASASTLRGLERQIHAFAKGEGLGLAQAYWPGYDSLCHELGCDHPRTRKHLEDIDRMLARLTEGLHTTDCLCVVTADHGLVDTTAPQGNVELREVQGLYDCLSMLPSGDSRGVHCFVRPSKVETFLSLVSRHLKQACACLPGEALLELGAFGPGDPHSALRSRVGDFVLVAREGYGIQATPAGLPTHFKVGNHGGMSAEEVLVPLYVIRPE
jgi:predicted AlkP superfamily pyrophosphatase or phosphodiesterase